MGKSSQSKPEKEPLKQQQTAVEPEDTTWNNPKELEGSGAKASKGL